LLQEYAEAKLALMNTDMRPGHERRPDNERDDYDGDANSSHYSSSSNPVHPRGPESRTSSNAAEKDGRKYRCRENQAWFRAPVHQSARRNPASWENPASRENRGTKLIAKRPECTRDCRSPLGVITPQDNLLVLGQSGLPPLPSKQLLYRRGYLDN